MLRQLQEMRGKQVVSLAEGRIVGVVQKIHLNSSQKKVSGLTVRSAGRGSGSSWVAVSDISQVGEDVVFVTRAAACKAKNPTGRSLQEMMGMQVATRKGKILGALVDVEVDDEWKVTELTLSDRRLVPVDPRAVFGQDAIILASDADTKIKKIPRNRPGILSRLFGSDLVEEVAGVITRAEKAAAPARTAGTRPARGARPRQKKQ